MEGENRYDFFRSIYDSVKELESETKHNLDLKYYSLFMDEWKVNGLSEDPTVRNQQYNFIFRQFWANGSVAGYVMPNIDFALFAKYSTTGEYNLFDFPTKLKLINERGVSNRIIPKKTMEVGKDAVILYANPHRKPICQIVKYYTNKMLQAEMVLNSNLNIQQMPFMVACEEKDKKRLSKTVEDILNGKPVVFTSVTDISKLQVLLTQAPFLVDKLKSYVREIENELLTVLGIDNNGDNQMELSHVTTDAVCANDQQINSYAQIYQDEIQKGFDEMNYLFGTNLTIEPNFEKAKSIYEGGDENDDNDEENVSQDE